ncbi:Signal transduction histidine kinase [Actinokineospora alba]|uniref:Signal transduction histidine-protein kinase/phosphatase MprB n=1 Tax=Actinokineospora alba TaxID=504798 RepID=A0A1H0U913_9PSEU|nr:ATP-binding protein [Actinokineospora alba]TDP65266.1 signal transduction histidine kinase [Actinokineospora alba]SDH58373.1 Signal transduction histidine kinase [Actinokineospora alba]SDP62485.1 Signal transduction histidine kinase [Actinokineospora alba]
MRRRILRAILIAVLVTAFVLGIPLGYTALQIVESLTREDLAGRAQQIAATLDDEIAHGRGIDLTAVQLAVPANGRLTVVLPGEGEWTLGPTLPADIVSEVVPIVGQGQVRLSVDAGPMRTRQTQVAVLVALVVALTVAIGTVVATATARRLARPLRHVAQRATRLGAGDFRLDPTRYDLQELDLVAEALDASATALALLVQRERDLVSDVSHQLRSRLTALQLRLEALAAAPDAETSAEAGAALEQAERLADVLDELLAAAREARAVDAEPIDLSTELAAIADEWRGPLRSEGRSLRLRLPAGLLAKATPARLREAIGVLLDNALRHGGGTVTLSARNGDHTRADTVVVEVTDAGAGVPQELAPHIFDRGVSGAGSTGLGLALARALVDSDGGRLELSTARPATFTVFLPVPKAGDVRGVRWSTDGAPR